MILLFIIVIIIVSAAGSFEAPSVRTLQYGEQLAGRISTLNLYYRHVYVFSLFVCSC